MTVQIVPVEGIGEISAGDDLADTLLSAIRSAGLTLEENDILVVTHKIVSKAENAIAPFHEDEEERRRIIEQQARAVVRRRGDLVITQTRHGFICANAGVDRSNMPPGRLALLPSDPDRSAHRLRTRIQQSAEVRVAVIISDTFGRAWRRGLTDVAIGVSGMAAIVDYRDTLDSFGRTLTVTEVALVDEVAAAADLVMGKATGVPLAIVRGVDFPVGNGRATDLVRPAEEDLFR